MSLACLKGLNAFEGLLGLTLLGLVTTGLVTTGLVTTGFLYGLLLARERGPVSDSIALTSSPKVILPSLLVSNLAIHALA